ncbi:hypothetical protein LMG27952_00785 [Paraburkholderia hiiakae]|uniref:Uncharacterized protein n=1 Tax=Paraburkholderia hiiakae TaxID=1081782 RepID=A0ABM8NBI7_9BURK|nr:hypothetical protein LMG27952_00785 [Paraburkholderia hiiakae]
MLRHVGCVREACRNSKNAPTGGLGANSLKRSIKLTTVFDWVDRRKPAIAAVLQSQLGKRTPSSSSNPHATTLWSVRRHVSASPDEIRAARRNRVYRQCTRPMQGASKVPILQSILAPRPWREAAHNVRKSSRAVQLFHSQSVAPSPGRSGMARFAESFIERVKRIGAHGRSVRMLAVSGNDEPPPARE